MFVFSSCFCQFDLPCSYDLKLECLDVRTSVSLVLALFLIGGVKDKTNCVCSVNTASLHEPTKCSMGFPF